MELDDQSDFTCIDGECHDFKHLKDYAIKRGNVWVLVMYFFCGKCLKEMANERKSADKDQPVWWKAATAPVVDLSRIPKRN